MLVLSRKIEEEIMIGDSITVKILGVQEGQVRIGIVAPKETKIFRAEVYKQIQLENLEATKVKKTEVAHAAQLLKQKNTKKEK
jgi:carbon storage regulator